jgi:hypothetical protein
MINACAIFCSLKFRVVCTCTFFGDTICLMIKIAVNSDWLTYCIDIWLLTLLFSLPQYLSESCFEDDNKFLIRKAWVVLFFIYPSFYSKFCLPNFFSSIPPRISRHGALLQNNYKLVIIQASLRPAIRTSRSSANNSPKSPKFVVPKCTTVTYQRFRMIRATRIRIWNHLADELNLNTDSLSSFKSAMFKYHISSLSSCYDVENPRSYKTMCPKCNSVIRSLTTSLLCCMWELL